MFDESIGRLSAIVWDEVYHDNSNNVMGNMFYARPAKHGVDGEQGYITTGQQQRKSTRQRHTAIRSIHLRHSGPHLVLPTQGYNPSLRQTCQVRGNILPIL